MIVRKNCNSKNGGLYDENGGLYAAAQILLAQDETLDDCGWETCQFSPPAVYEPIDVDDNGATWDRYE